ncbi:MAG: metallophosphoesterase [Clostridioides sp.]|jgi:predicted phosphohydrolase|nr:metallophosphoesterase [Clostridioides sp.]
MALYAIGDLHFSTSVDKPMNVFGENWSGHMEKILSDWRERVCEEDMVLVLGDTSWGIDIEQAGSDLDIINSLPGKKIFIKGNHDYWWSTVTKLKKRYPEMEFLHVSDFSYEDYAICGGRGWLCPNAIKFDKDDEKIYLREERRIRMSLESAKKKGYTKFIVCTHYPPTNDRFEESIYTKLYEEFGVSKVVYGHLHGEESFKMGLNEVRNGVEYRLASCDYTDFKLVKIL